MNDAARTALVEQAREALDRGEWDAAYALLCDADGASALRRQEVALLAEAAYVAGHLDQAINLWERVHADSLRVGDSLAAAGAAVRVAMHLLFDTALLAPVRGWLRRTEQLLEGHDDTPVHARLAVVRSYERLLSGDFRSARDWARRAEDVGGRHDAAAAVMGRVAEARSLILEGEVEHGLRLLDDAGVEILLGEIDPLSTGVIYCEIVCALQGLAQYDLAEQWTEAMERWQPGRPVGSVHGRCRVHRAEILRLRGSSAEAEKEALQACEDLRPYLRRELGWPLTELGRIRLRRGDIGGANEAFTAAHSLGWDPQPGLAQVHLAAGDAVTAAALIRDALEHPSNVPSKELPPNTELRRAPLLEAQIEIEVELGELLRGRAAAEELTRIASRFGSKALAASAAQGAGRVEMAAGNSAEARRSYGEAVHLWSEVGAPYETALARFGLGSCYRAEGLHQQAELEFRAAETAFAEMGTPQKAISTERRAVGADSEQAGRLFQTGDTSVAAETVFRREGDFWSITFDGQTIRLRDLKGLHYLSRLLAEPGQEQHVLSLTEGTIGEVGIRDRSSESGLSLVEAGHMGPLLDAQAKDAYRRRLADIDEDLDEATRMGDSERASQASTEREFLARELARAVGLRGRDRVAGSPSERARASVTRAIRHALARISEHHPQLGRHLEQAIRTGTYCAYFPDERMSTVWKL